MELPPLPRETVLILVGWNAIGLAVIVAVAGPWVLGLWAVAVVLTGIQVAFGRRRLAQPFTARATPTGAVVAPVPPGPPMFAVDPSARRAWNGSALVPTALGGMNASAPLAELSISGAGLQVRVRPAVVSLAFGYRPTVLAPSDVEMVLPVTRTISKGVAILQEGRPPTYCFNVPAAQILGELQQAGFPVDWREQRVRLWGRAR